MLHVFQHFIYLIWDAKWQASECHNNICFFKELWHPFLSSSQIYRSTVSSVFLHRFPYLIKMDPQYTRWENKWHCNKSSETPSLNAKPALQPIGPRIIHSVHQGFYISSRNEGQHIINNSLRQTERHHQHSPADVIGFSIALRLTYGVFATFCKI